MYKSVAVSYFSPFKNMHFQNNYFVEMDAFMPDHPQNARFEINAVVYSKLTL